MFKRNIQLTLFLLLVFITYVCCQISFPQENEFNKKKANAQNRRPLYAPTRCGKHELLYPGDQEDDWICDCEPAAIYSPKKDACFPAFYQEPCATGELFVLRRGHVLPECRPNACKINGQVMIKNKCYELGKAGPCPQPELSNVLGVDPNTLQLDCVNLSVQLATRFSEDTPDLPYDLNTIELCPRGSKRDQAGQCST